MREKFAQSSINFITKYYTYEGVRFDRLKYGLESLYSLVTKTTVILIVAILLGTLKETALLILCFAITRCFAFGIHAENNLVCWLTTIPIYAFLPFLLRYIDINSIFKIAIISFSFISFALFAPADTRKKPLINPKKRVFDKIMTLLIGVIFSYIAFTSNDILLVNTVLISLLLESICINPITYFLCKSPYNNYKNFEY